MRAKEAKMMTTNAPLPGTCAFCDEPAEGNYAVHRDGFGEGPEVDLCNACGSKTTPTLETIWARIAQPDETQSSGTR